MNDEEAFKVRVQQYLIVGDATALAHSVGVSTSTVHRWAAGIAIPYVLMRAPVYAFIDKATRRNPP